MPRNINNNKKLSHQSLSRKTDKKKKSLEIVENTPKKNTQFSTNKIISLALVGLSSTLGLAILNNQSNSLLNQRNQLQKKCDDVKRKPEFRKFLQQCNVQLKSGDWRPEQSKAIIENGLPRKKFCEAYIHDVYASSCYYLDKIDLISSKKTCQITGWDEKGAFDKELTSESIKKISPLLLRKFDISTVAFSKTLDKTMQNTLNEPENAGTAEICKISFELGCGQVPDFDRALFSINRAILQGKSKSLTKIKLPADILRVAVNTDLNMDNQEKITLLNAIQKKEKDNVIEIDLKKIDEFSLVIVNKILNIKRKYNDIKTKLPSKTGTSLYVPMTW